MIRHVVFCKFRKDLSDADIVAVFDAIKGLQAKIGGILAITTGRDMSPEGLQKASPTASRWISPTPRPEMPICPTPNTRRLARWWWRRRRAARKAWRWSTGKRSVSASVACPLPSHRRGSFCFTILYITTARRKPEWVSGQAPREGDLNEPRTCHRHRGPRRADR